MGTSTQAWFELRSALVKHHAQLVATAAGGSGLRGEALNRRLALVSEVLEDVRPAGESLSLEAPEAAWTIAERFYDAWTDLLRYDELIERYKKDKRTPGVLESLDSAYAVWDDAHGAIKTALRDLDAAADSDTERPAKTRRPRVKIDVHGNANITTGDGDVVQTLTMVWQEQTRELLKDVDAVVGDVGGKADMSAVTEAAKDLQEAVEGNEPPAKTRSALDKLKVAADASGLALMTAAGSEVGTTIGDQIMELLKTFTGLA